MLIRTKSFKQGIKQIIFHKIRNPHDIKHSSQLSIKMTHENKTWVNNKCECTNKMWRSQSWKKNVPLSSISLETRKHENH